MIADALADVRSALGLVSPLDVEIQPKAVALARAHGFSFYDARILASALAAGCDTLPTEDLQAGQRVGGVDPVWWRHHPLGGRSQRCRGHVPRIRWSSAAR